MGDAATGNVTMEIFDLAGKIAIITGSTGGIGLQIAERMAEHGARVVVCGRTQSTLDKVVHDLGARFGADRVLGLTADITKLDSLERLADKTLAEWGGVDILVCNARHPCDGTLEDVDADAFNAGLSANVTNAAMLTKRVVPSMRERGGGSVIFISSTAGIIPMTDHLIYGAAKVALCHMASILAMDLGRYGIRVNAIAPGSIRTGTTKPLVENAEAVRTLVKDFALPRIGEPDEIAAAAVFLCSPGGGYTTGQTIVIDGGQVLSAGRSVVEMTKILADSGRRLYEENN